MSYGSNRTLGWLNIDASHSYTTYTADSALFSSNDGNSSIGPLSNNTAAAGYPLFNQNVIKIDVSRRVPTARVNRPRSYTSYLCLYAGPA